MPTSPRTIQIPPPRRILIIKPSAIGDVVHALPILNLLRTHYPAAHIAWLVAPACADLLHNHPQLDEVILFHRKLFGQAWYSPKAALALTRFLLSLRRRFDLVIDLQGLLRSGLISLATQAPARLGLSSAREGAPLFYTHTIDDSGGNQIRGHSSPRDALTPPFPSSPSLPHRLTASLPSPLPLSSPQLPPPPPPRHALERYLDLTSALGLPRTATFIFNTTAAHREKISALLAPLNGQRFAVLFPGANWQTKRWPPEKFHALTHHLHHDLGLATVVAGASSDTPLAQIIRPTLDLTGQTSLPETTALLERAALVIANDTGPMHIAAALGRPLLALFGPTSEHLTGPYNRPTSTLRIPLPCAPCLSRNCSHTSCMNWLSEHDVLEAAKTQLNTRL